MTDGFTSECLQLNYLAARRMFFIINLSIFYWIVSRSEKTSGDFIGEKGVMGTHDMETFNFFKGTRVHCALAPRELVKMPKLLFEIRNWTELNWTEL